MNAIVAVNSDWGIGLGGTQTIIIPEDRRYFRELTEGGVVICGRKTFEDFCKPLPNRRNIILTRNRDFRVSEVEETHPVSDVVVAYSVSEVLAGVADDDPDKVFIIGGESIYRQFLHLCSRAYVTKIEAAPESDAFFPNLDAMPGWSLKQRGETLESAGIRYSFLVYKKQQP